MTKLVGIINLTPDSFSDGGAYPTLQALKHAVEQLITEGVDVIDVGAESTRPGAIPLLPEEEWNRLSPFFAEVFPLFRDRVQFSLDTRHPETAHRALDLGVDWINDVSGLTNRNMRGVVRGTSCKLVLMHSLSVPADPVVTLPEDTDPVEEVLEWMVHQIEELEHAGIARNRLILDPGIGFGKTAQQSLLLLKHIDILQALGLPVLIGHSRKRFLQHFTAAPADQRDDATLAVSAYLIMKRIDFLRVHAVMPHRDLVNIIGALHG